MFTHLIETFEISPQGAKCFLIPQLAICLSINNVFIKMAAVSALGKIGGADLRFVVPLLAEALKYEESWTVRLGATIALGSIGEANPHLVLLLLAEALIDTVSYISNAAAEALIKIGGVDLQLILPLLANALKNKSNVRMLTVDILAKIGGAEPQFVLPLFADALKDEENDVKAIAAEALGNLGQANPEFALPLLTAALEDKSWGVRKKAAEALCKICEANPSHVPPSVAIALKNEIQMCFRIDLNEADELDKICKGDPQLILPLLAKKILCGDDDAKDFALKGLGKIGQANPQFVLPLLAKVLKDKFSSSSDHVEAINALGKIGGADPHFAIPLLAEALKDLFPTIRGAAANALGEIGDACLTLILPLLAEALKDESSSVKVKAVASLKKYNLSLYFKSNNEIIRDVYKTENSNNLLISTPLSSLITCFKEDLSKSPIYSSAIALKCIEENLAIFQEDDFICFYEQGKLCRVTIQKTSEFLMQIDNRAHQYPAFILELQQDINISETNTCVIQ